MPMFLIKPLICALAVASIVGGIWWHGYSYREDQYNKEALDQALSNADMIAEIVKQTEDETRGIYEAQIKNLKRKLSGGCTLGPDYVVLHDTAAGVPESAETRSVTSEAFARHVADNYARCRQNEIWLNECQRVCQ